MPADAEIALNLEFAAGDLNLAPADSSASNGDLVSGKATFNVPDLAPIVESVGMEHTIRTGKMEINGIPVFDEDVKNEWDLQIGQAPLSLKIQAGAYRGDLELGGLAISAP